MLLSLLYPLSSLLLQPSSSSSFPPFLALCHPLHLLASGLLCHHQIHLAVVGFTQLAHIITDFLWGLTSLVWVEEKEGREKQVMTSVVHFPPLIPPPPPCCRFIPPHRSPLLNSPLIVFPTSSLSVSPSSLTPPSSSSSIRLMGQPRF